VKIYDKKSSMISIKLMKIHLQEKLKKKLKKKIIFIYEDENFGFGGIVNKNFSIECVY
jgi:hypothetical protein